MKCERCQAEINPGEVYWYGEQNLCEDCYLDLVAQPKTCDPWAVFHAQKTPHKEENLTSVQKNILNLIKEKGPLTEDQICNELNIDPVEFQNNFSTLRHMELAKGCKVDDQKCFTLFNS